MEPLVPGRPHSTHESLGNKDKSVSKGSGKTPLPNPLDIPASSNEVPPLEKSRVKPAPLEAKSLPSPIAKENKSRAPTSASATIFSRPDSLEMDRSSSSVMSRSSSPEMSRSSSPEEMSRSPSPEMDQSPVSAMSRTPSPEKKRPRSLEETKQIKYAELKMEKTPDESLRIIEHIELSAKRKMPPENRLGTILLLPFSAFQQYLSLVKLPIPESFKQLKADDQIAIVYRGCKFESMVQMVANQSAGNKPVDISTKAPSEAVAVAQVGEQRSIPEFGERKADIIGFSTGGVMTSFAIPQSYLTKGSGLEGGWVANEDAPALLLAWRPGRAFI